VDVNCPFHGNLLEENAGPSRSASTSHQLAFSPVTSHQLALGEPGIPGMKVAGTDGKSGKWSELMGSREGGQSWANSADDAKGPISAT
jgi:hypothetical protein